MVQSVTFTTDEIAEESVSIKVRETCGSSLAVLRVHLVLLNQASTLGIVRSRERSNSSKKKKLVVNAWYQ